MKKILGGIGALALAAAGLVASMALAGDGQEKVTLCHAAGLAGTTHYVTLTVGYPAAFGPAGHFMENGTPNAGHEQDYLGACEGDEEPPTTTGEEPPTTTGPEPCPDCGPGQQTFPTETQPPPPPPPHVVTGNATVICDRGSFVYRVSGTIDGQAADSVTPATIPGSFAGTTNVTVTRGDTSHRTSVTTNGDCGPPATSSTTSSTPPAANSPQPTTPPATTTPGPTPGPPAAATPGQPAEANPPASTPGQPAKAKPPKGAPITPAPGEPCPPGTTEWQGKCNANVMGAG